MRCALASLLLSGWFWISQSSHGFVQEIDPAPLSPLRVCMLSGSEEYESDRTLAQFKAWLESRFPVDCTLLKAEGTTNLPGLDALASADVVVVFTRRLTLPAEQLEQIQRHLLAAKPIVAIRTASHAFQNWLEFDKLVLGGNYRGHYGAGKTQRAQPVATATDHPVLRGIGTLASRASLYKTGPLAPDCTLLMNAQTPDASEPATWVRAHGGRRVFYTALGGQGDFDNQSFLQLLANALFWTARRSLPEWEHPGPIALRASSTTPITLSLRHRVERPGGGWEVVNTSQRVPASEIGVVVCDMWDQHWCRGATERCDAIAAKMEPVLASLRERGVQIVHAPSETMAFYAGLPQRLRAQRAPHAEPPASTPRPDPPLPIDDRDGGCDTDDTMYLAWTRQNPRITIAPLDAVSDQGDEVYNLFQQLRIKHVLIMGVHTNMCILNRSFAIKAMSQRGMRCVLVRDLTDTMYDPADPPFVSHDEGTALVVEHIEKYWCPSTTSPELMNLR